MKISRFLFFMFMLFVLQGVEAFSLVDKNSVTAPAASYDPELLNSNMIYASLQLNKRGLSYQAFDLAMKGMRQLNDEGRLPRTDVISIADFSQSSCRKRLYVIDLQKQQVLFQTYVAHGRNSGEEYASSFSNDLSSNKTSLGFYSTLDTYIGDHGISLHLKGEEPGINDRAYDRSIVMHGADYVSYRFIQQEGRLGRSLGCPAVPTNQCKSIIDNIKGGSCLFIYYPDVNYEHHSPVLNS